MINHFGRKFYDYFLGLRVVVCSTIRPLLAESLLLTLNQQHQATSGTKSKSEPNH